MTSASPSISARPVEANRLRFPRLRDFVVGILFAIPAACTLFGLPYYMLGQAARVRADLHPWLKPSGPVGLGFGIAGFAMFLFMWLYPLRKSFKWLAWTGPIGTWLRVHSVTGLLVPLVVAVHAGWRFDGLIGLGYVSMFIVSLSGLIGRYLYTHIPRSRDGAELTAEEVANERRALVTRIAAATGLDPRAVEATLSTDARSWDGLGPIGTLRRLVADDLARRRAMRALRQRWLGGKSSHHGVSRESLREVLRLARREIGLRQQARMLEATRRVFALWHVAHRPFAITAFLAVAIHVAVAILLGAIGS